jgi:hypothetical protein
MGVQHPNSTSYVHPDEPNLLNLHKAMEYAPDGKPHVRVFLGSDTITITGDVNLLDSVRVNNSTTNPVPVFLTNTSSTVYQGTTPWVTTITNWPALQYVNGVLYAVQSGTWNVNVTSLPAVSGTVAVSSLPAITGTVAVSNFPTSVTVTNFTSTVNIASLPEVEIKNDSGNPIPITGNVTATIGNIITVVTTEDAGDKYSFNNHAANATRGWTMDNTMRPVVSFQNGSADAADIIKILEYEIGNNNANQSTIVYEWYEGPLTIAGAAIPSWTTFGVHSQYRVYQDQYSSNQGNTFTVPAGTYMRHSGIIIGKNTSGDEGPASLYGGNSRNMLTLCMRRVDNATKLDVWFAFTVRELV